MKLALPSQKSVNSQVLISALWCLDEHDPVVKLYYPSCYVG